MRLVQFWDHNEKEKTRLHSVEAYTGFKGKDWRKTLHSNGEDKHHQSRRNSLECFSEATDVGNERELFHRNINSLISPFKSVWVAMVYARSGLGCLLKETDVCFLPWNTFLKFSTYFRDCNTDCKAVFKICLLVIIVVNSYTICLSCSQIMQFPQ